MTLGFVLLGVILLLFIAVPLAKVIFGSDAQAFADALLDAEVMNAIWLTLWSAFLATFIGFLLGVPLAYILARRQFPCKGIIEGLVNLPIVVPHTAAGIALLFVFGKNFFVGQVFENIGISFVDSTAGIVVAMMFVSVPFLVNSAKEGFKDVDVRLENVSRSLGATPWQAFTRVSLPLAKSSILAGCLMMWARGISEFGAIVILAYYPVTASVLIWERFQMQGLDSALPITALLVIIALIIFIAVRVFISRGAKR